MSQYLLRNRALIPSAKGTFCTGSLPSSRTAGLTRSFVPRKLIINAATDRSPNTIKVLVQAAGVFPKYSTRGRVNVLMVNVPAVARRFLKMLRTDLSYGSWVISAFSAEYGTLIAV